MTEEEKKFEDLVSLGGYLKKHRRLKGKKIEMISNNLYIKKTIIKSFEEGSITCSHKEQSSFSLRSAVLPGVAPCRARRRSMSPSTFIFLSAKSLSGLV